MPIHPRIIRAPRIAPRVMRPRTITRIRVPLLRIGVGRTDCYSRARRARDCPGTTGILEFKFVVGRSNGAGVVLYDSAKAVRTKNRQTPQQQTERQTAKQRRPAVKSAE